MYAEIDGDLISLAKQGKFDVIAHGCNCFCTMGAGIAPQMAKAFGCDTYTLEQVEDAYDENGFQIEKNYRGDINKLGQINFKKLWVNNEKVYHGLDSKSSAKPLYVVNAYTQYNYGANHADGDKKPVDCEAITLVMRKINRIFAGKHIGLPKIGSGLAGGSWKIIQEIIKAELTDCDVTVVNYNG